MARAKKLDVDVLLKEAVRHFWVTRAAQSKKQGERTGLRDAGNRTAVTGAKHADGFVRLVGRVVEDAGVNAVCIHTVAKRQRTLPGFFRPCKEWDLLVVSGTTLIAAIEVKSQVGSFGNNFNNRVEEAVGNAADFWKAFAKGQYAPTGKPWLGYLFMLEAIPKSTTPTRPLKLPHFPIDPAFDGLSYAQRYEEVCRRLVRERLYDAACFVLSDARRGTKGIYEEPSKELGVKNFARQLHAHAAGFAAI